ncbi:MAG: hypothetical protein ABI847_09820 [Anaerolineales bacterium]
MGTWISHLRIAENLLSDLPGLDPLAFSLGSLAPDSGVPNADWSIFDPPKSVTHFLDRGTDEGKIADLAFYRRYLAGLSPAANPGRYGFRLAYFYHLVSDRLWSALINDAARVEFAGLLDTLSSDGWWKMKADWYDLDHKFVRENPQSLFWRLVRNADPPVADLDFLPAAAIGQQLAYIQNFYGDPKPRELDRPYPFLNAASMDRYVASATASLLKIHAVVVGGTVPAMGATALQLLPEADLAPFSPPLGDRLPKAVA